MARKSYVELRAQANSTLPDNAANLISAADVRNMILDFLEATQPAYGTLSLPGPVNQEFGQTPTELSWSDAYDSDSSQTTSSAASNDIVRGEKGTVDVNFSMDCILGNGVRLNFFLIKNGGTTGWSQSVTGDGNGDPVSVSFSAIDYNSTAATYSIEVTCQNNGQSVELSEGSFICSIRPVNNFT